MFGFLKSSPTHSISTIGPRNLPDRGLVLVFGDIAVGKTVGVVRGVCRVAKKKRRLATAVDCKALALLREKSHADFRLQMAKLGDEIERAPAGSVWVFDGAGAMQQDEATRLPLSLWALHQLIVVVMDRSLMEDGSESGNGLLDYATRLVVLRYGEKNRVSDFIARIHAANFDPPAKPLDSLSTLASGRAEAYIVSRNDGLTEAWDSISMVTFPPCAEEPRWIPAVKNGNWCRGPVTTAL